MGQPDVGWIAGVGRTAATVCSKILPALTRGTVRRPTSIVRTPSGRASPCRTSSRCTPTARARGQQSSQYFQPIGFVPRSELILEAWEEHFDKATKRNFWYNERTKEVSRCKLGRACRVV